MFLKPIPDLDYSSQVRRSSGRELLMRCVTVSGSAVHVSAVGENCAVDIGYVCSGLHIFFASPQCA